MEFLNNLFKYLVVKDEPYVWSSEIQLAHILSVLDCLGEYMGKSYYLCNLDGIYRFGLKTANNSFLFEDKDKAVKTLVFMEGDSFSK